MSISTSDMPGVSRPAPPSPPAPLYVPGGRVNRFESEVVSKLCGACGCLTVTELPGGLRPPLELTCDPPPRILPAFPDADGSGDGDAFPADGSADPGPSPPVGGTSSPVGNGNSSPVGNDAGRDEYPPFSGGVGSAVRPGGSSSPADDRNPSAGSTPGTLPCDLALSRRFGNPGASVPDPDEVADELSLLFSLSCRYAVALYPAGAGTRIGQIASGLWRPFTLEGFVPHRFTETFHDRGESSGGDLYIFALEGEPLPLPFTAPGGRHARRSPCGSPSGNPEDPEMLLQAVKELASRGETGKAVPLLSRLARMRPEDTRLRLNLGYFLLNIGSLLPAAEAFRSALADEPDNGEARRALAGIFLHLRDWAGLRPFLPELMILRTSSPRVAEIWPEIRKGFIELERGA